MNTSPTHIPVLFKETLTILSLAPGMIVLDGTFGSGGHSREIARRIAPGGTLLGIDQDPEAIGRGEALRSEIEGLGTTFRLVHANFRSIRSVCNDSGIQALDRALFDLGFSTPQIEDPERGLSFIHDGPLDMRLNPSGPLSAADIVNSWKEEALADLFYVYGDERRSRAIARAIVSERKHRMIARTKQLAEIISRAIPRQGKIHPATRVFQALRIAVNDELGALREGLKETWELISPGGILAVISFHSGEDRIVKEFFKEESQWNRGIPLTKKPIPPADEETRTNPRSRSAKLRALKKETSQEYL